MHPGTDAAAAEAPGDDLLAQGEGYARALLDRIGAGASSPDELADLLQFLHAGPMLHAAYAVIFLALRSVVRPEGQEGRDAR
jgi:hypothetical protein